MMSALRQGPVIPDWPLVTRYRWPRRRTATAPAACYLQADSALTSYVSYTWESHSRTRLLPWVHCSQGTSVSLLSLSSTDSKLYNLNQKAVLCDRPTFFQWAPTTALQLLCCSILKDICWTGDDSVAKSTACSSRGWRSHFQHPRGGSQSSVTTVAWHTLASDTLFWLPQELSNIHWQTCRKNTHTGFLGVFLFVCLLVFKVKSEAHNCDIYHQKNMI